MSGTLDVFLRNAATAGWLAPTVATCFSFFLCCLDFAPLDSLEGIFWRSKRAAASLDNLDYGTLNRLKNLGGKKNACVSAYRICGVTKSEEIKKKLQKTPS